MGLTPLKEEEGELCDCTERVATCKSNQVKRRDLRRKPALAGTLTLDVWPLEL